MTDKLERVVVDSGNGNIKEEAEVDNLINSEETGPPTNTETETDENKEEVESINGEEPEAEAPDNNLLDLNLDLNEMNAIETSPLVAVEDAAPDNNLLDLTLDLNEMNETETRPLVAVEDAVNKGEVEESEQEDPNYNNNKSEQEDPNYNNNKSEKEDNEGRKKRKRN